MSDIEIKNPDLWKVCEISGHFFVPSYQRGYRWGRHEVGALLSDIYANGERNEREKYCLQPVVVKRKVAPVEPKEGLPPAGQEYYELIDGQQRLTTLYLLYLYLQKSKGINPRFSLSYETRPGSTAYLRDNLPQDQRDDNIDFFHMHNAYEFIDEWFVETATRTVDQQIVGVVDDIYRYLRNNVYVIRYDAGDEDSITLFTRLNIGRIALTNAELVKALLLASREDSPYATYRQVEIATQWDMIEQDLQNDAFWAFLTNRSGADYPTRIELLFDLLAQKPTTSKDRYFTFEYFKRRLSEQEKTDTLKTTEASGKRGQLKVWEPVLELYHLLREWFEDKHNYHKVGYLVAINGDLGALVAEATGGRLGVQTGNSGAPTKTGFQAFLDTQIAQSLGPNMDEATARGLDYLKDYDYCERLLLLFNVESVRLLQHSTERYPFDSHKKERWSLEHIHAQNAEPMKTEKEWRVWLADGRRALEALPRFDSEAGEEAKAVLLGRICSVLGRDRVERKDFDPLARDIMAALNAEVGDAEDTESKGANGEVHSLANLALLSGKVNSALNNGAFLVKRLRIMDLDQDGEFIPVCTRRVFLKYYTRVGSQQMHLWSREDQRAYLDVMLAPPDGKGKEGVLWKYLKKPAAESQL